MMLLKVFNLIFLSGLGLITVACSTQTMTAVANSTVHTPTACSVVTSTVTNLGPVLTGFSQRFCPWCFNFDDAPNENYCNLLVQVPETLGKVFTYPALIFNHDFTILTRTETIIEATFSYSWHFPDLEGGDQDKDINVVFIPATQNISVLP